MKLLQILKEGIANIVLVGSEEAVKKGSEGLISAAVVVDPATSDKTQGYIGQAVELRQKKGMTLWSRQRDPFKLTRVSPRYMDGKNGRR